jgi:hypothetical protein
MLLDKVIFVAGCCVASLTAQPIVSATAGLILHKEGDVYIRGAGKNAPRGHPSTVANGQQLFTKHGRVEVLLAPGVFLRMENQSDLLMNDTRLSNTVATLLGGSALVEASKLYEGGRILIRLDGKTAEVKEEGVYEFDASHSRIRVFDGSIGISGGGPTVSARRGDLVELTGDATPRRFDPKDTSGLYEWSAHRSFELAMSEVGAIESRQSHWYYVGMGWLWNDQFRKNALVPSARTAEIQGGLLSAFPSFLP